MGERQNLETEYRIAMLIAGYLRQDLDPEQEKELQDWLEVSAANRNWMEKFCAQKNIDEQLRKYHADRKEAIWNKTRAKIHAGSQAPVKVQVALWQRIAVAASIIIAIGLGLYFYHEGTGKKVQDKLSYKNDVEPGRNTATLTLASGETIKLSDAKTGLVARANQLRYNDGTKVESKSRSEGRDDENIARMTLSTPRGGTYQIVLSDGTKVWLNAASSLTYSTSADAGAARKVTLSGEAYFEVAKDKNHPFMVSSKGQNVEVLGTHFNISSYADEAIVKTTLLEGAVKVTNLRSRFSSLLKPSQQAEISGDEIKVKEVDTDEMIAWKNGYFKFVDEDMQSIMRKIGRWYDVEIAYADKLPNEVFSGRISRSKNLSQVLKMIASANAFHFKVEGRRVVVIK